ncbi:MAG: hypothetical protein SGBAC_002969 [Bacillariaceae sp.]
MNATQAYEYGTPRTAAAKLFGFSSALWGLILTATYTANLASLLVTTSDSPLGRIQGIEDVTYLKYPVCTWGGTILDSHLEANHASTIRKPKTELVDVYNALNNNECFFAVDTVQGWLEHKSKRVYNPACKLEWVGGDRKVAAIGAGFVAKADAGFKCTSLIRDVVDYYMEQLVSEGWIEKAWEIENKRKQDLDCDTFRPDLQSLETLQDDSGRRLRRLQQEVALSPGINRRRRLKASTKSAASAAGALDGGGGESQQMELSAMIGSFFIHWVAMVVALVIAASQRYRKQKQLESYTAKEFDNRSHDDLELFDKKDGLDKSERSTADIIDDNRGLKHEIKILSQTLAHTKNSQARLLEEQSELRGQIEKLSNILEKVVTGKNEVHINGTSWLSAVPAQVYAAEELGWEKKFFTAPQMSPEADYRQDVCDQYNAFQNGTVQLKDALRGMKLNVLMGAYNGSYFNYNDEDGINGQYPGIAASLMDELALRAGFTWRSSFGIFTDPRGAAYNETWTDVLTWGVEHYDVNVDWWASNVERLNLGVAYTKEWYDSSIILVGKEEPEEVIDKTIEWNDFWNWTKPFTVEVWITTFATILLSGFVYMMLEWLNDEVDDRNLWRWFTDNLYLSAINATQAYEYGTPRSFPAKLFGVSMALWALILTATYTANLASLLVDRRVGVLEIETVAEAAVFGYPICTVAGTNADTYIQDNFPQASRRPTTALEDMYEGANSGQCAFAADVVQSWLSNKNKRKFNRNCDLEWVGNGRVVASNSAGFATKADAGFKCTGLIRDVINFHMEQMIADETVEEAWEFDNKRYQDVDCETFRPELLDELNAGDTGSDATRRRNLVSKQQNRAAYYARPKSRRMKAGAKAAASSAAIESEGEGQQMELEAMIGSFFIHWALMALAMLIACCKKLHEKWFSPFIVKTKAKYLYKVDIEGKKLHAVETEIPHTFGAKTPHSLEFSNMMKGRLNEDLEVVSRDDGMLMDGILTDGSLQSQIEDLKYSFDKSEAVRLQENQNLQSKMDMMIQENQDLRAQLAILIGQMQQGDETMVRHA